VDRIFVHKIWGLLIFASIMGALFVSLFWLAQPMMDAIQALVGVGASIAAARLPAGPIKDLVTDGIFAGVGTVLVFIPQIALLFLFLAVLEDTGYLARAAFLMDRVLSKVGLHGKSFIPLLSSFACAIPGIMATRTIENRKDRLATILVAPFMSCSARLPVYTLLIGAFFASASAVARGGIMLACYALGILAAVVTAFIFKRTLLKGPATSFILELPSYKLPQISQIARQVWTNTKAFITKAGTTIFCLSVILWAMTYYPRLPQREAQRIRDERAAVLRTQKGWDYYVIGSHQTPSAEVLNARTPYLEEIVARFAEKPVASEQQKYSIAGRFGHLIEPVIRSLGFDWKMGVGLVGAFAAREVFVSTMGITYAVGDTEESGTADLSKAMQADRYPDGRPVWTPLVAVSLLVWFVLAMQCMSTIAIVRRETGGWSWPIFMIVYMNGLAYVVSLVVYQVGKLWFA
jgi:ferrous iron transport protein B